MTIEMPIARGAQHLGSSWTALPSFLPVPGMGALAVNSFLLKAREPLLVDTGLAALSDDWLQVLEENVDPRDLRWIWLSHLDADHIGNLQRILDRAPRATIVTSVLGLGKMGLAGMDCSRVRLLEPGQPLDLGDRQLVPMRPPYYDAPETLGFFETGERAFFAADSFGAVLPEPLDDIAQVSPETLRDGLVAWASLDAPWLSKIGSDELNRTLAAVERLDPAIVLSGHLPPVSGNIHRLTAIVRGAWGADRQTPTDPFDIDVAASGVRQKEQGLLDSASGLA